MFENYDPQLTIAEYKINDFRRRAQMDRKASLLRGNNTAKRPRLSFHWAGLIQKKDNKTADKAS